MKFRITKEQLGFLQNYFDKKDDVGIIELELAPDSFAETKLKLEIENRAYKKGYDDGCNTTRGERGNIDLHKEIKFKEEKCLHKWKLLNKGRINSNYTETLTCEKCGALTKSVKCFYSV